MDWSDALLFFAVLLALYASARAAGLAQGTARRNGQAAGTRPAPQRKKGQGAEPGADGADTAKQKPLHTALDNLTAYGTNRQQTEVEDRHEIWEQ